MEQFIEIVKKEIDNVYGYDESFKITYENNTIECRYEGILIECFYFLNNKFIIKPNENKIIYLSSLESFGEYVNQLLTIGIPTRIMEYNRNFYKQLPTKLRDISAVDIHKLNIENFTEILNTIFEDHGNSEQIDQVELKSHDTGLEFIFNVDCGRSGYGYGYHRRKNVFINNRGYTDIDLCDTPMEGAVEGYITEEINKIIRINQ